MKLFFIILILITTYLIVSLISFNPLDPSWSQTTWDIYSDNLNQNIIIHNLGGRIGAWLADFLFLIFGEIAYLVPLVIINLYWTIFYQSYNKIDIDYFNFTLRLIGALVLLIAACGVIQINLNNIWYFNSGGLIGNLLSTKITRCFGNIYSTSILIFLCISGIFLHFNISWFVFTEKIGSFLIKKMNLSRYYSFYSKCFLGKDKNIRSSLRINPQLEQDDVIVTSVKNKSASLKEKQPKKLSNTSKYNNLKKNILIPVNNLNKNNKKDIVSMIEKSNKKSFKKNKLYKNFFREKLNLLNSNQDNAVLHYPIFNDHNKYYNLSTLLPKPNLLKSPPPVKSHINFFLLKQIGHLIENCLADYRIKAKVVNVLSGPVITCFELELAPGVKSSRISNLSNDLARLLSVSKVRVVEIIPGKPYLGLELPNRYRRTIYLREVLDCNEFYKNLSPLCVVLGKDTVGKTIITDLSKMPHLLVAGTTGSGKSVGINALIISILYKATPEDVRFIMIDPKMLELSVYNEIPHLLTKVIINTKDAINALRWCIKEMEHRYQFMSNLHVRSLESYNEIVIQSKHQNNINDDHISKLNNSIDIDVDKNNIQIMNKLPYIVIIIDELSDLMMSARKEIEELITRLTQKSRAAGIHLVLATQRPSVDVITGLIKANIPSRIAFTVSSKIDSRTILDQGGAELLLGMGDMLYLSVNSSIPIRIHGAFVHDQEIQDVVNHWKKNNNLYSVSTHSIRDKNN